MALALVVASACWGCGSGGTSATLIPVKGKVSYKGQPLTQGFVYFEPTGFGRGASGKLQSDGTYVLSTLRDDDGVVAGTHRVYISEVDAKLAKDRAFKKYMQANGSKLTAEVSSEKTVFNFDLN